MANPSGGTFHYSQEKINEAGYPGIVRDDGSRAQPNRSPDFARSSERLSVTPAFLPAPEFGQVIAKEDAAIAQMMQVLGLKKSPG